jgi:hypothetical protein
MASVEEKESRDFLASTLPSSDKFLRIRCIGVESGGSWKLKN